MKKPDTVIYHPPPQPLSVPPISVNINNLTTIDPKPKAKTTFTTDEISQILAEDAEQYDISLILGSQVLEDDLKQQPGQKKLISKIIYSKGKYIKAYCEGFINEENRVSIRMQGICEDGTIIIKDEELSHLVLSGVCKLILVQEVLPYQTPLKLIKTFDEFCQICFFPFMIFKDNGDVNQSGSESEISHNGGTPSRQSESSQLNSNMRQIDLWGRSPGILLGETLIVFLSNRCNVSLHYLQDESFRLGITSLEGECTNPIFIELQYDKATFNNMFEIFEHEDFTSDGEKVPLRENEVPLRSLKLKNKDYAEVLKSGIMELENFLWKEFGDTIGFNFLVYERTGLIYQIRLRTDPQDGLQMELWSVRDSPTEKCFKIKCKTLYDLRLKKHQSDTVERDTTMPYNKIWTFFGVNRADLSRPQLHLVAYLYLTTLFLYLPTMELNKGDDEDSENEEQALISNK